MTGIASKPAASDGVTPSQAERFASDLARLRPEDGRLGLAVSGGPDSLALLLLAHAAIPGRFAVATVNHGLRPEAADECAMVERVCTDRGIACAVLQVELAAGNLQAEAREARYAALAQWAGREGLAALATAHHADDQAETLVMRLNRASGLAGLAGVRARGIVPGAALPLLRPLLAWRRAELAAIVANAGLEPARDASNADEAYDRVRIRNERQNRLSRIGLPEATQRSDGRSAPTVRSSTRCSAAGGSPVKPADRGRRVCSPHWPPATRAAPTSIRCTSQTHFWTGSRWRAADRASRAGRRTPPRPRAA